ncbi:MAG: trypsin-like peptidase domain-containing protein [Armatimonadetes bacterium]|nr:trypsin-like peptidase domain-containing protein [Armatimonadota bacterium]
MFTKKSVYLLLVVLSLVFNMTMAAVPAWSQAGEGRGPAALLLPQEQQIIDIVRRISPAVVAVMIYNKSGEREGEGSGVIVSKDGVILTNNHVISGASKMQVTLADGRELQAKSLGGDPTIDLAVLKVNANNLPVAAFSDSDNLQVGQIAIAIGNPYGFERTVSVGVVSALKRTIPDADESLTNLIQTDARIFPGNSGGPLLDSKGNVIGINTAIVGGRTGALGFAIPINTARDIVRQVQTAGRIILPWIGVSYGEISPEIAKEFGLPVTEGVIVASVEKGGPAALAGIRKGDIIVAVENKKVIASGDLRKAIRASKIGAGVDIQAFRDGKARNFVVTVREMPTRLQ